VRIVGSKTFARSSWCDAIGAGVRVGEWTAGRTRAFEKMIARAWPIAEGGEHAPMVVQGHSRGVERVRCVRRCSTGTSGADPRRDGDLRLGAYYRYAASPSRSWRRRRVPMRHVGPPPPHSARTSDRCECGSAARSRHNRAMRSSTPPATDRICRRRPCKSAYHETLHEHRGMCFWNALDRTALEALVGVVRVWPSAARPAQRLHR